jgi:hypothetical protein
MIRELLCRLGFHGPIRGVAFSFASYLECGSCLKRWAR